MNLVGKFLSFEGPEGSGKSTQLQRLLARLAAAGIAAVATREPGGSKLGEAVRNLVMHTAADTAICAEAELLLFAASRAQLVREVVRPALAAGQTVVCDRFLDSSTVYQGLARGLPLDPLHAVNMFAVGGTLPDLTLLIDVPPEVSRARISARRGPAHDRIEAERDEFHRKVRDGYLRLAQSLPERFAVFDGTQTPDRLESEIWKTLHERVA